MSERDEKHRDCADWRDLLAMRTEHDIDADDEAKLQAHLKDCVACQGVASWIGDVDALAAMAAPDEPSPESLRSIERQVMDSVRRVQRRPRRRAWQSVWIPSTAVAAVVALLTWMQSERHSTVLDPPEPAGLEQARPAALADAAKDQDEPAALDSEAKAPEEERWNEADTFESLRAESTTPGVADEAPSTASALEKRQLTPTPSGRRADTGASAKTESSPATLQQRDYGVDTVSEPVARMSSDVGRLRELQASAPTSLREMLELTRDEPTDSNIRLLLNLYAQRSAPEDADEHAQSEALTTTTPTLADSVRVFLLERVESTEDAGLRTDIQEALRE